jgi:hypothetical protein
VSIYAGTNNLRNGQRAASCLRVHTHRTLSNKDSRLPVPCHDRPAAVAQRRRGVRPRRLPSLGGGPSVDTLIVTGYYLPVDQQ